MRIFAHLMPGQGAAAAEIMRTLLASEPGTEPTAPPNVIQFAKGGQKASKRAKK